MNPRHNPRTCHMCGTVRSGFVLMRVRKGLPAQARTNGENAGGAK